MIVHALFIVFALLGPPEVEQEREPKPRFVRFGLARPDVRFG